MTFFTKGISKESHYFFQLSFLTNNFKILTLNIKIRHAIIANKQNSLCCWLNFLVSGVLLVNHSLDNL